jgi:hypothetical protein
MKKITITGQTLNQLYVSEVEKDVENSYRQFLSTKIPDMIFTSPYLCDGYGVSKKHKIRILCEFKKDFDFRKKSDRVIALCQVIVYIKKFVLDGTKIPNIVLVGDKNEWFVLHVNELFKYLDLDIDWSISPSSAHTNKVLFDSLMNDNEINPFVFDVTQIDEIVTKIKNLAKNVVRLIPITPKNMVDVFTHFEQNVLAKNNLNTNQLANLFTQLLINPDDNYLHPVKKRKTIVTKAFNEVPVKSREAFISFFNHFSNEYTPRQKEDLTATVDRLIQDVTRRNQGEFFTPTPFVDLAHKYVSETFGDDWKENFIVWDCAWGTGNLTRDYKFKELYASTLNYSDIQTTEQMGYNLESNKFQFDFLNDDYDFLPKDLKNAIEGDKDILFLINPPYIKATPNKGNDNTGVSNTIVGKEMNDQKLGIASSQLSTQFLYRITKLQEKNKKIKIGIFNKPNYMTSDGFKDLRNYFLKNFGFVKGFLFNASHFSDTANSWGISFSIWDSNPNTEKNQFRHKLVDIDDMFNIIEYDEKILYNCDNLEKANNIFKNKEKNDVTLPVIKSYLTIETKKEKLGSSTAVGYINNHSNNLMQQNVVFLASSVISANGNKAITPDKFYSVINLFTARKVVQQNWINDKDEYLAPNENHQDYQQFTNDSVVYSLFNNSSQQSSLRQVTYKDQLWDIKNEFFWMSKEEIMELANNSNYNELYSDARTDNNRYVHNLLFGEENIYEQLSPDAKLVLDKATELVRMSMTMRSHFADDNNHLNSWDAGYAQLKLLWKEYFPEEFKEFRQLYKNLEDRMRPLVYELGFLLK